MAGSDHGAPLTVERAVGARLGWVAPELYEWYPRPVLEAQLAADLAGAVALVGDRDFASSFRRDVGVPVDVDELAWANQVLRLGDGGWALTGIRFRGLDVTKPFVDVVVTTAEATPAGVAHVAAQVATTYAAFGPLCVRFDVPDPDALVVALDRDRDRDRDGDGTRAEVDQYVVAGLVTSLRERPTGPSYDRVELRRGEPGPLASRAAAIYDELHRSDSRTRLWATAEDAESLAACAEQGLLFEVRIDGEPAGVVAALREDAHGLLGHVVEELCLDAGHRGRGLAQAVLEHLVRALPDDDGGTLWGTIHPDNAASLRNSLGFGRRKVGGFLWVTPPGLPGMAAPTSPAGV
jgi:GNAT superfamily N-acetyltransferase